MPLVKNVCGTLTSSKRCDDRRYDPKQYSSLGNVCAVERSNGGSRNGFWKYTDKFHEPNVRGRTVFVQTSCSDYTRLPQDQQTDVNYRKAMQNGAQLPDDAYKGWIKVWQNDNLWNRMLGEHVGVLAPGDMDLTCFSMQSEPNRRIRDAEVMHCQYRVGQLMETPEKLVPILKNDGTWMIDDWYGGCSIYVQATTDWADDGSCQGMASVPADSLRC
jgi:hypothetical protein